MAFDKNSEIIDMDMLRGTLSWVYVAFLILVFYGIKSCFPHNETKKGLVTTIIFIILWSLYNLSLHNFSIPLVMGCVVGIIIGWLMMKESNYMTDELTSVKNSNPGVLKMNSTPLILIIYMIIFAANYWLEYKKGTMQNTYIISTFIVYLISSAASGIIINRSIRIMKIIG